MPSIVAVMLDRLQVTEGDRVLEIGTGTGYNAALLCARLGDHQVTSVEVDEVTAAEAARHLAEAGYRPTLVVGDGAAGHEDNAPYDRIIATCAISRIPRAWIEQLADGGLIVAPLTLLGGLAVLRKTGPAEVSGRLDQEQAYFMTMRPAGHGATGAGVVDIPRPAEPLWHTTTSVPASAWQRSDFRLWLELHLPECGVAESYDHGDARAGITVYLRHARAEVDYRSGGDGAWPVRQDSARLWDTVEAAWHRWRRYGRPDRTRIGITARAGSRETETEQFAWLDHPGGPLRWPLPRS